MLNKYKGERKTAANFIFLNNAEVVQFLSGHRSRDSDKSNIRSVHFSGFADPTPTYVTPNLIRV